MTRSSISLPPDLLIHFILGKLDCLWVTRPEISVVTTDWGLWWLDWSRYVPICLMTSLASCSIILRLGVVRQERVLSYFSFYANICSGNHFRGNIILIFQNKITLHAKSQTTEYNTNLTFLKQSWPFTHLLFCLTYTINRNSYQITVRFQMMCTHP